MKILPFSYRLLALSTLVKRRCHRILERDYEWLEFSAAEKENQYGGAPGCVYLDWGSGACLRPGLHSGLLFRPVPEQCRTVHGAGNLQRG